MITIEAALKELKNLSRFPAEQLKRLAACLAPQTIKKNGVIFEQGEKAGLIYLLLSGVIKISYNDGSRQTIVSMLSPGDFFGFDALIPDSGYSFRGTAYETSTIAAISPVRFVEDILASTYEAFLPGFTATLHLYQQLHIHCIRGIPLDLRRRIGLELLHLATRFGEDDPRGTVITLPISHETLADIVGGSRQQVTEHLNALDRDGLISREGRRIIVHTEQLRRAIEGQP